jgi:hypothetical protein
MNAVPEAAQTLGFPGLAFETWETSALNRFVHQEQLDSRYELRLG